MHRSRPHREGVSACGIWTPSPTGRAVTGVSQIVPPSHCSSPTASYSPGGLDEQTLEALDLQSWGRLDLTER